MKKGVMMGKKYELILLGIIFLIVLIGFVFASVFKDGGGNAYYNVKEDQQFTFNITVNNTESSANITWVNITLDSTFSYKNGTNGSNTLNIGGTAFANFTNTTTILAWSASTSLALPGTTNSSFWFNAIPSTPGNYTFNVMTGNSSQTLNTTSFTVTVLEIHNVMRTSGSLNFGYINEDQSALFNITLNSTIPASAGNMSNITITFPSALLFVNGSNYTELYAGVETIFTNTITSITWINSSAAGLLTDAFNGSVWFNLSGQDPGTYNFSVTTINSQDSGIHVQTFMVIMKEIHNIMTNDGTRNFTVINEDTPTLFNITLNSSVATGFGNITNITITFPSNFTYISNSNNTGIYNGTAIPFTNTSTSLTWINSSGIVTNAYNMSVWFNLTANDPGTYNFSVTTINSQDNGTHIQNFTVTILDITDPDTPTYNCTKTSVSEGEYLSCSCTAKDNYDATPTLSYTYEPSTTNSGTYTVTCTATDDATYNSSSTVTYTVLAASSSLPGSSGGTTYTTTYAENSKEFSEIKEISKELGAKSRIKIKINNSNHEVGIKALTTTTATIEVSSTPQTATLSIGDVRKFDVTNDGYYDLSVTLSKIASSKASITLKSIYEKITQETVAAEQEKEQVATEVQQQDIIKQKAKTNRMIWIIVGIIVVLILVGIGYGVKRKKR